jgi:hypothetical protein
LSGFVYDVGGYEIRSTFPLPGLRYVPHSDAVPAILVDASSGPAAEADRVLFRWPGQYGLTLSACGGGWLFSSAAHGVTVISSDGRSVQCYPDTASSPDWPELLVRRILPRLLQWHGRVAVHAATVADERTATVLLGSSRAGKSTLAAALRHFSGWHVLSDDISLIDDSTRPHLSLPTGGGLCLWPDSLSAFVPSVEACRTVAGHEDKRWLHDDAGNAEPARPVGSLVVLTPNVADERRVDDISFRRIAPKDAAVYAGDRMMCFNPRDPTIVARAWAAIGRLVEAVPMFSLSYPRGYQHLASSVAPRLSALLRDYASVRV